jgi:radical SAM superfamily enzyme YgiQ (UPF0313 family)
MKILLINVSLRPKSPVKFFPIGLGYIATAMKNAGFSFDLLDIDAHRYTEEQVRCFLSKNKYDVVCMGCLVTGYKIIKSLASVIKEYSPNSMIIVGNSVASSIPDILLKNTKVDIAVMGEGDIVIVELLKTLLGSGDAGGVRGICFKQNGRIIKTAPQPLIKDISTLPFIDFSIFDVDAYIENSRYSVNEPLPFDREQARALPVNTARGCIANCSFCYHVFKGHPYRYRKPESIVNEIRLLIDKYRLNYIYFWDELTFFSKKQTLELVQKIIDSNLRFYWVADCRADLFDKEEDLETIEKIKMSGCLSVAYSLESASPQILKSMNKHITVEQFSRQTELFKRGGIEVLTSLVLGYPQETPATIKQTFDCCIKNKIYPSVGYLLPQPGSEMYDYAVKKGFITNAQDYLMSMGDRQDLRINMTGMTNEEFKFCVLEGVKRCNEELGIGLRENELIKTQYYRTKKA